MINECPICYDEISETEEICKDCVESVQDFFNIYVIECQDNYYYIGKTTIDVGIRFSQHKNFQSCAFTSKYKPIKLVETFKSKDPLDEDKITKKYMMKYGIEKVRGGSYTKLELDDWMIKSLEHEFASVKDLCYNCNIRFTNMKGHSYHNCYYIECPLNKKSKIDEYLEKYKDMGQICMELDALEKVYEKIIILNHQIKITNQFDVKKYNQLITDIKELDGIILSIQQKLQDIEKSPDTGRIPQNFKYSTQKNLLLQEKRDEIQKLVTEKQALSIQLNSINIIGIYIQLFVNDKIYIESEDNKIIKLYKLQAFNLEKKKELKELLRIHTSEELVKMKLEGLYEKKISILSK